MLELGHTEAFDHAHILRFSSNCLDSLKIDIVGVDTTNPDTIDPYRELHRFTALLENKLCPMIDFK